MVSQNKELVCLEFHENGHARRASTWRRPLGGRASSPLSGGIIGPRGTPAIQPRRNYVIPTPQLNAVPLPVLRALLVDAVARTIQSPGGEVVRTQHTLPTL
jgi:hypothetical protein